MSVGSSLARRIGALPCWTAQVFAGAALLLYYFLIARHIPPTGDEVVYLKGAVHVRELVYQVLHMEWGAASRAADRIVDSGWFMPGMSVVIAPATLVIASTEGLRLYIGALNFALLCLTLEILRDRFGPVARTIFLCLTLAVPYYGVFSFLMWGDLVAAQVFLLIGLFLIRRIEVCEGHGLPMRIGAILGLSLGLATYLRASYLLCLPLLLAGILYSSSSLDSIPSRIRHLLAVGGICSLVFGLLLAPWSFLVSRHHGPHLTITSAAMSQIVAFGSEDYLASVRQSPKSNLFRDVENNIRTRARQDGISYREQARKELQQATAQLTFEDYSRRVVQSLGAFFLDSELFLGRFRALTRTSSSLAPRTHERLFDFAETLNYWMWRILLVCGILLFLTPVDLHRRSLALSLFFKYMMFFFSLQPFVVVVHGRYYVEYVPYIATAIAIAAAGRRQVLPVRQPSNPDEWTVLGGQVFALAFGAVVLIGVALLA